MTESATESKPTSRAVRGALVLAMAGLLCLAMDWRSEGVETLLPDAAGYALLAVAMHLLSPLGRWFRVGRWIAAAGAVIALGTVVESVESLGNDTEVPYEWDHLWPVTLAERAADVAVVWALMGGLRRRATQRGRFSIATPAHMALGVYVTIGLFRMAFKGLYLLGVGTDFLFVTRLEYYVKIPLVFFHVLGTLLALEVLIMSLRRHREFLLNDW